LIERLGSRLPHQLSRESLSTEVIPTAGHNPGSVLLGWLRTVLEAAMSYQMTHLCAASSIVTGCARVRSRLGRG